MNRTLLLLKKIIIIAIPISLVFSIYLNSIITILFLCLFLPDLYKNFKNYNLSINRKAFFVLNSFVLVYLIGIIIDFFFDTVNFRKSERLLPFIIFPLIFFFSGAINTFKDKKIPLRIFARFVTYFNVFLILALFFQSYLDYEDNSIFNDRWKKTGIAVLKSKENSEYGFAVNKAIINTSASRPNLLLEKAFDIKSDTSITRSVYIKSDDDLWVLLRQYDGSNHKGAWFNIKDSEIGFIQKGVDAKLEQLKNGWNRIALTNQVNSSLKHERIQLTFVDGNKSYNLKNKNSLSFFIGGPQIEISNNASNYDPFKHKDFFEDFNRDKILNFIQGHPTYYSLFILLSIMVILMIMPTGYIQLIYLIINVGTLTLLGSKAAILTFFGLLFILLYYNRQSNKKLGLLRILLVIGILFVLLISNTFQRFTQSFNAVQKSDNTVYLSTDKRMEMWKSVVELPLQNLLVGNGNTNGYALIANKTSLYLNTHNQYLEAILCSGILGLLLLLYFLIGLFLVDSSSRKNKLLIMFVFIISFNLIFENILNRQWGIVFIAFFLPYIYKLGKINE